MTSYDDKQAVAHIENNDSPLSTSPEPTGPTSSIDIHDKVATKRLLRRIDLRLLPLCSWIYLLNYLDRGNIGNAKILNKETNDSLQQRAHLSATQYAIVLSLFSLAYAVFEVPSNWVMKRYVRPSLWLAALLLGWSCFTLGFMGADNYAKVLSMRFFIGVFEAGFFPGIVYLITFWYRPEERALRIAFVVASATLAGAFGGCIAYGAGHLNRHDGLRGYQWLFLIEGVVSIISVLFIVFFLPDYPARARWLKGADKTFAIERLRGVGGYVKTHATKHEIFATAFTPRMLAHYFAYITDCVPLGSLTFYTPQIVAGLGYTSIHAQLLTVPPWVVGYFACLGLAYGADKLNMRGYLVGVSSTIGGIGWLGATLLPAHAYTARYGMLILCACGAFPSATVLTSWITCNAPSMALVGIAAAMNNSGAGVSQIIVQWIWRANEAKTGYPTGNAVCAACSFATASIALCLRLKYGHLNKINARDAAGKGRVWLL